MALPIPTTQPAGFREVTNLFTKLRQMVEATPWTGWVTLAAAILIGVTIGKAAQIGLRAIAEKLFGRKAEVRAIILQSAASPFSLGMTAFGLSVGLSVIVMPDAAEALAAKILLLLYTVALTWFVYNLVRLVEVLLRRLAGRTHSALDDHIIPMIIRSIRLFIFVIFVLFVAQNIFGADITAWLTGLGIVGLAVSLGAQDTIKNLFGSMAIFLDRTFAVGDHIVFDTHDGFVEDIGFRSTKLRTLDGAIVTIPNARIMDGSVRNVSRRHRIRRMINLALVQSTPADKVEEAMRIVAAF